MGLLQNRNRLSTAHGAWRRPWCLFLGNCASRVSYQFLIRGERGKWLLLPAQRGVLWPRAATQQAEQGWDRSLPSLGVPPVLNRWEGAASAGVSREGSAVQRVGGKPRGALWDLQVRP